MWLKLLSVLVTQGENIFYFLFQTALYEFRSDERLVFQREFEHQFRNCKLCAVQYWLIYYIVSVSTDGLSGRDEDIEKHYYP